MRVAIVAAKYPYDNREAYLDRELRALAPHLSGIAVFPVSPRGRISGYRDVPADVHRLGLFSPATIGGALTALATRPLQSLRAIGALLFARDRPRMKLKNLAVIPLGLAVGMRLRRGGFEHVHAYWLSTPASVAYLAAAVAGIPWSSTAHRWDIYEANALAPKLRSTQFVRAISARGRRDLLEAVPGIPPERVRVLHVGVDVPATIPPLRQAQDDKGFRSAHDDNGVRSAHDDNDVRSAQDDNGVRSAHDDNDVRSAHDDNDVRSAHDDNDVRSAQDDDDGRQSRGDGERGRAFSVVCVANLVGLKGHRDLLAGVATARGRGVDVRCTIAGDGELRGELEALAAALQLGDAVTFRGHVAHDALLAELDGGRYDALALTSLEGPAGLMEGIPVALMEAMARGVPVIATASGSVTELVDERCGRVVPPGDAGGIAAALVELAADRALGARLAAAAYQKVCAEFDVVAVARELARLFAIPEAVTSEQAMGSIRPEEARSTEAADAAWGQG